MWVMFVLRRPGQGSWLAILQQASGERHYPLLPHSVFVKIECSIAAVSSAVVPGIFFYDAKCYGAGSKP
ncbi:hypothetical protein E2C01_038598 [Portunus trituberculatus]|uniref:Uncharacterized protein n=1 Tax=Portunus trituberculatus TaxID=210409 RepID=A0A5B7FHL7_PORTR|nr:hypothetical protein [Portunus trituberculatus]